MTTRLIVALILSSFASSLSAQATGLSPEQVASLVLLSTLISFATLPLLLAYLL